MNELDSFAAPPATSRAVPMSQHALLDIGPRSLIDASPDASLIINLLGQVVVANREAERLLGWSESELLGQALNRLFPQRFHRMLDTAPSFSGGPQEVDEGDPRESL